MTLAFNVSPGRVVGAFVITVALLVFLLPLFLTSSPLSAEHLFMGALTAVNLGIAVRVLQRLDWIEKDLDLVIEQTARSDAA